jgi:surface antigen
MRVFHALSLLNPVFRPRHGLLCISLCFFLSGCGITLQMPGLFTASQPTEMAKDAAPPPSNGIITPEKISDDNIITGSIKQTVILGKPAYLTASDWELVKLASNAAVIEVKDEASKEWLNPETGTFGSISLISAAQLSGGKICRSFLASAVVEKQDNWFEGKLCRKPEGGWAMSDIKQWKKG